MNDLRTEAMKMALEFIVLASSKDRAWFTEKEFEVVAALRQALAQPEQKQWQNLTDDEIKEIVGPWGDTPIKGYTRKLFDQIEAKLKEKNT